MLSRIFRKAREKVLTGVPVETTTDGNQVFELLRRQALSLPPAESLKLLFEFENSLYVLLGRESIRYGGGIHTKHRHTSYHGFFISNLPANSVVLDIGCGNGSLAADIAKNVSNVRVIGIDMSEQNIALAKERHQEHNVRYFVGDALKGLPDEQISHIVLSNVLEHIDKRIDFLKQLINQYNPKSILIRVPCFDRDWRVPLKKELGVEWRLDPTHFTEYLPHEFSAEMAAANLDIIAQKFTWGEIWAVTVPKQSRE